MEALFVATVSISVVTVAWAIRALVLGRWAELRWALLLMVIGGAVGYVTVNHDQATFFRERLLGITVRIDVLRVYLGVVLAGFLGFVLSSLGARQEAPK